ncbi:MAG: sulfatase family protein [Planctomycetota bacterium]
MSNKIEDRPHVLILMPDQMRADCMSCAGHPVVRTPNIDRLAGEGVRFANAYTTSPVCMPARSSFLSGLFCHNHGQWGNYGHLPADADTFARRLADSGYRTCHVGKSHYYSHKAGDHLGNHVPFMNALGWQDVFEATGPFATQRTDSIMTDHWRDLGCLDTYRRDYARRGETGWLKATWPSPMPKGEALDDFIGRTATEYIDGYDRDEPLLMFVGFGGPHNPWDPPADWAEMYDPQQIDAALPPAEAPSWLRPAAAEHQRNLQHAPEGLTPALLGEIRARYYAKISHIDWWVGRILDALERRGMLESTAVIFWSDHGEMLGDKGRFHKGVFYDAAAKVPLILRPPNRRGAGGLCHALTSLVDIFPTVLELAGCDAKEDSFGRSLRPLVAEPWSASHDAVFSEIDRRTMIRDGRYKMVVDCSGAVLKLYKMLDDPDETTNLVGKAGSGQIIRRLRSRMLDWYLATQKRQSG